MDSECLVDLLRLTLDPNRRKSAEEQLNKIQKVPGFAPLLLKTIMLREMDLSVRQAGAVYFKNFICQNWKFDSSNEDLKSKTVVTDDDKYIIRESLIASVVHSPDLVRNQLCTCLSQVIKQDFPAIWTRFIDQINEFMIRSEANSVYGALLSLYQLTKFFESKRQDDRKPLETPMKTLLPQIYSKLCQYMSDLSETSALIQKTCLKIYFSLTQYNFPYEILDETLFAQWMKMCMAIIDRPSHLEVFNCDEEDRPKLAWWKTKKWAIHILYRMFERYGSPGNVSKEYEKFAAWYLATFSNDVLEVIFRQLDLYKNNNWLPPRVLHLMLSYINKGLLHSYTWKTIKKHIKFLVEDIIFPLLNYTAKDNRLWKSDPLKYIRLKFDVFECYDSPVFAAQYLLNTSCKKRKGVLQNTLQFLFQVLESPDVQPFQKDGALLMLGSVSDVLIRKRGLCNEIDNIFVKYVFPEFRSPQGHLRARACWMVQYYSQYRFQSESVLFDAVQYTVETLIQDRELPVKIQAATAIQMLLSHQNRSHKVIETYVKQVALQLLNLIRETANEDVSETMNKLVYVFTPQLIPIAVELCKQLSDTFLVLSSTEEALEDKALTAKELLSTMETLLTVLDEKPDIHSLLEPPIIPVVNQILQNKSYDFFDDALNLLTELTSRRITRDMWKIFDMLYQIFLEDGTKYFIDMMPTLHNFIVIDTNGFLEDANRLHAVVEMCKYILIKEEDDDELTTHAAKLLEVLVLQCRERLSIVIPVITEVVASRLLRETSEDVRGMCLLVLIALVYHDPHQFFTIVDNIPTFATYFMNGWLASIDDFSGIHDRKMCMLALSKLVSMSNRPKFVETIASNIMATFVVLFDGLQRAYSTRKHNLDSEEMDEDYNDVNDETEAFEDLNSDEDDVEDKGQQYLERISLEVLKSKSLDMDDDSDNSSSDYDMDDETLLESYETVVDDKGKEMEEFIVFKETMENLEKSDPEWYQLLCSNMTEHQRKSLLDLVEIVNKKKQTFDGKATKNNTEGFTFTQQTIPQHFNFTTQYADG